MYRSPHPTLLEASVKTGVMWVGLQFRSIHLASLSAVSSALASKSLVNFRSSRSLFDGGKSFASYSAMRRGSVSDVLNSGSKGATKVKAGPREGDVSISTASTLGVGRQGQGSGTGGRQTGRRGNRNTSGTEPETHGHSKAGQLRVNVHPGTSVEVVQKQHQRSGQLTPGVVSRLLTNSGFHPRGIKVMLSGGVVGRVQNIVGSEAPPTISIGTDAPPSEHLDGNKSGGVSDHEDAITNSVRDVSTTIGKRGRRRAPAGAKGDYQTGKFRSSVRAPESNVSTKQVRKFRAGRVVGRSWSIEGGELVARGEGGEELSGVDAALSCREEFVRERHRGRRGRGQKKI